MSARRRDGDEFATVSRRRFLRTSVLLGGTGLAATAAADVDSRAAGHARRAPGFVDVRDFGATGDGRTDDTRAIQHAIDAAHRTGGATVELPAGVWLSGTLRLRARVTLDLAPGAVLLASADDDD